MCEWRREDYGCHVVAKGLSPVELTNIVPDQMGIYDALATVIFSIF
jgi:hypothetical protein